MSTLFGPMRDDDFILLKLYLFAHPPLLFAALVLYPLLLFGPWAHTLNVTGHVSDPQTRSSIADAKVVVSVWNFEFGPYDRNPTKFLLTTDQNGDFKFAKDFDFIIWKIDIEACAPDVRFAAISSDTELDTLFRFRTPTPGRQRFFYIPGKGHFELSVYELRREDRAFPFFQYDTFEGGLGGEPEIIAR